MPHIKQHDDELLLGRYSLGEQIGTGKPGVSVHRANDDEHGRIYAVKVVKAKGDFTCEVANHSKVSGVTNCLRMVDHEKISGSLVMEYAPGGDLFEYILAEANSNAPTPEFVVASIMRGLIRALEGIHEAGYVHGDVKPENVLLMSDRNKAPSCHDVRLGDFESLSAPGECPECTGTTAYLAPEASGSMKASMPRDMWAAAVVAFMLLKRCAAFEPNPPMVPQWEPPYGTRKGCDGIALKNWSHGLSTEAIDFLQKLFRVLPGERLTATQALQHPWLVQHSEHAEAPEEDVKDDYQGLAKAEKSVSNDCCEVIDHATARGGRTSAVDCTMPDDEDADEDTSTLGGQNDYYDDAISFMLDQIMYLGFNRERTIKALRITGGRSMNAALEWLLSSER